MAANLEPIDIDISQVLALGKQGDDRFKKIYAGMQFSLSQESFLWGVCIHESGHAIFFKRAGITGFDYYGPTITYDEGGDEFCPSSAIIEPKSFDAERPGTKETILAVAKGCAAGGVVTRRFAPQISSGDQYDYHRLCTFLDRLRSKYPNHTIDVTKLWPIAQFCVEKDLQNNIVQENEIDAEGRRIEPLIFKTYNFTTFLDPPKLPSLL